MSQRRRTPPWRQGCPTGKRGWETRADAKLIINRIRKTYGRMRPYRCDECNYWHTGHRGKHWWADAHVRNGEQFKEVL